MSEKTVVTLEVTDSMLVKPDKVKLTATIASVKENEKLFKTSKEAYDKAYEAIDNVIKAFKLNNIDDADIDIGYLSINEETSIKEVNRRGIKERVRVSLGHYFYTTVSASMDVDKEKVYNTYLECTKINEVRNIDLKFYLDDEDKYYNELVEKIIKKGRKQVDVIAKASDLSFDSLSKISNTSIRNHSDFEGMSFMNCLAESSIEEQLTRSEESNRSSAKTVNIKNMFNIGASKTKEITSKLTLVYLLK